MSTTITLAYEALVLVKGSLKPTLLKAALERVKGDFAKTGKILNEDLWENRILAYKIGQETTGTYLVLHFEAAPSAIPELTNTLRLDPDVVRSLITKAPKGFVWKKFTPEDLEADYTKIIVERKKEAPATEKRRPMNQSRGPRTSK